MIRKISIGADYKSSAMHYVRGTEVFLWKEFNPNMPISIEYNINF